MIKDDRVSPKVHILFDAISKIGGSSLNDRVYPGPMLTEPLLSVISRFRGKNVSFAADREKGFFQASLKPEHRNYY